MDREGSEATNDFDRAARRAVLDDPAGHTRWLLPHLPVGWRYRKPLPSQSAPRPGEPDRRCDTIAELVYEGGMAAPWAAVLELFTNPDSEALDRLGEYLFRFRRELRHGPHGKDKYRFAGVLLFLTDGPADGGDRRPPARWRQRVGPQAPAGVPGA
ncbi:MAG: hypothetical protein K2W96_00100 [Gemmataceae bacterium]|nr:hypothetical protein [Gemmataceae bacterium]